LVHGTREKWIQRSLRKSKRIWVRAEVQPGYHSSAQKKIKKIKSLFPMPSVYSSNESKFLQEELSSQISMLTRNGIFLPGVS
jgi:hypothetical protein